MITVYLIGNTKNEKLYIGQTKKLLSRRLSEHKSCARNEAYNCCKLENAINKYGEENFFIEKIFSTDDQDEANAAEISFIKEHNSIECGYNIQSGGMGNRDIGGARNPRAKLTEKQMKEILYLTSNKIGSQSDIAKQFGVHRTTIQRILYNQTWITSDRQNINVKSKLSVDNIKDIKKLLMEKQLSYADIAGKYGVSKSMIAHISRGRIHSNI